MWRADESPVAPPLWAAFCIRWRYRMIPGKNRLSYYILYLSVPNHFMTYMLGFFRRNGVWTMQENPWYCGAFFLLFLL